MSTISLTPPTSPPDQQVIGDHKLSIMPPPNMNGGNHPHGGYHHGAGGGTVMDTMYGVHPEIIAPPKTVANKLAGKMWKDWTLPRETGGRISPTGSSQGAMAPATMNNTG